jgi:hypothetical protein
MFRMRWSFAFAGLIAAATGNDLQAQDAPQDSNFSPVVYAAESATADVGGCQCESCKSAACSTVTCCHGHLVDWSKIPAGIRPMPRPGNFPIPPTGCGYYSMWDHLTGTAREKGPPSGYPPFALMPPSFFDADFRYVDKLNYKDRTWVERLKRIQLNDCWMFSTGGSVWARYMNEHNSRLSRVDNTYTLGRVRMFGDLMYGDLFRVYGEYLWADSFSEELAPLPIDVNRGDILNLFVDVNVYQWDDRPMFLRVGRQELLLGSQRLVSTLDWANTRRTFEGVRLFRQGEKWDFDAFWTQFVPADPSNFDQADNNQDFAGAWVTYRPKKGHFVDFYYLWLDNSNNTTQQGVVRNPAEVHTLGSRWAGDNNGYLWDFEGSVQFGDQNGQDLFAGAGTAGVGRNFKDVCWNPTAWIYYDYASGDANPNAGRATTYNQLYPFGHYYLGWIDLVGRQNIHDVNAHLYFYPENWITIWLQYHHLWLDQSRDALFNAGGVAFRRDPTGAAGNNVGDEIDIVLNFHLTRYADIMAGYSKLYGGGFLENTSGPTRSADADLFYLMYNQRW